MEGSLCHEFEADLTAAEVWEVYGSLLIGQLLPQLLPDLLSKVELVDGDGGVGTVLLLTFPPGTTGLESYKEKFVKVDNENYVKEAIAVEGGYLNYGFKKYLVRFEIIEKTDETSVIRSTIEYEVDEEHISNISFVSTSSLATIAEAITRHIKEQKSAEQAPKQTSDRQPE
ncbi:hypothetical protein ACQ4PT_004902 [Festuca glaucescens]